MTDTSIHVSEVAAKVAISKLAVESHMKGVFEFVGDSDRGFRACVYFEELLAVWHDDDIVCR